MKSGGGGGKDLTQLCTEEKQRWVEEGERDRMGARGLSPTDACRRIKYSFHCCSTAEGGGGQGGRGRVGRRRRGRLDVAPNSVG